MSTVGTRALRALAGAALALSCAAAGAAQAGLELGAIAQYLRYHEPDMHETGVLYGFAGELSYRWDSGWGIAGRARVIGGGLDYDGQTWNGMPVATDTNDIIVRGDFLVGHHASVRSVEMFAYAGLGARYWHQDIQGAGGYRREVAWRYLPVGLRFTGAVVEMPGWSWTAEVEFRTILSGTVRTHLSDVDRRFNDPKTRVDDGYGSYFSLGAVYRFTAGSPVENLAITPYLEFWDVDASDAAALTLNGEPVARVYEPDNDTTAYGLKISARF